MGIAVSGLIGDARVLCQFMRNECLNHRYVFESSMPVQRLVSQIADKNQYYTQRSEKRPYGVGLLVAGVDKTGPHLFQTLPSGDMYEYKAQAMGARSQSAKTYLEKHFQTFDNLPLDELLKHALMALKGTSTTSLTSRNCTVAYVGREKSFTVLEDDQIKQYVAAVEEGGSDEEKKRDDKDKDKDKGKPKDKDQDSDMAEMDS